MVHAAFLHRRWTIAIALVVVVAGIAAALVVPGVLRAHHKRAELIAYRDQVTPIMFAGCAGRSPCDLATSNRVAAQRLKAMPVAPKFRRLQNLYIEGLEAQADAAVLHQALRTHPQQDGTARQRAANARVISLGQAQVVESVRIGIPSY